MPDHRDTAVFKFHDRVVAGSLRTLAASSTKSPRPERALSQPRPCSASPRCTASSRTWPRSAVLTGLDDRQRRSMPLWNELNPWLRQERARVPDGGGISRAFDYSLRRWDVLGRFLHDGHVAIDNNHI